MDPVLASPQVEQAAAVRAPRIYEPELDLLRFLAFFGVFCFHAMPSDYSGLVPKLGHVVPQVLFAARNAFSFGVCMFFLLSAYLISKLLLLERATTGTVHMKSFYIRRILRIWPLYLGFLLVMWVLGLPQVHVFPAIETGRLLAFLFFSGNIYTGFFGFTFNPMLPLWTVSIEEQFYIVWPALALRGSVFLKRAAWSVIGLSVLATFGLRSVAENPTLMVWTSSLVHFQFFAIGSLIAIHFARSLPTYGAIARAAMAVAGTLLVLFAAGPLHINNEGFWGAETAVSAPLMVLGYEVMAIGIVLIFLAFLGAARGKSSIPGWLTYLGKISYGLYVFHYLALQICKSLSDRFNIHAGFRTYGAAALTLAMAMLSYRFFEKPFLLLKDRFAFVHSRPA
jgi:peptidoglycan/LPS O-acetylase OafA/YrhL